MLEMRTPRDCGVVLLSNLAEILTGKSAATTYQEIIARYRPFMGDDIRADLWDSPTRHLRIIEDLTGQKAGLIPDPLLIPCGVLLRLSWSVYHWVTVVGIAHGAATWHDGKKLRTCTFQERFPGCSVVLAYAPGGVMPLPWYYRVWGWLTSWVVG